MLQPGNNQVNIPENSFKNEQCQEKNKNKGVELKSEQKRYFPELKGNY